MPFKDIDIFLSAASAILQGRDPYAIPGLEVFYPLPFYFIFIPLVALPAPVVHIAWTALQAVILVAVLRRRALMLVLAMPVLLCFILGQVDIVLLAPFALLRAGIAGGLALAFLVLKPQLVLLLAPWQLWQWWQSDRRQLFWFALIFGTVIILSFIIQPDWIARLWARSGERVRADKSSSLWGLLSFLPMVWWLASVALIALVLAIWAWRSRDFDIMATVNLLLSPFIFSYNLMPLVLFIRPTRVLLGLVVLSWISFGIAALGSNDGASALMTLLVLTVLIYARHNPGRAWLDRNGEH